MYIIISLPYLLILKVRKYIKYYINIPKLPYKIYYLLRTF